MARNSSGAFRLVVLVACLGTAATACRKSSPDEFLRSGSAYVEQSKYPEAIIEFRKALQLDPFSYAYNYEQSGILYLLEQYDAALEKAQTVAALNPQVAGIHEWTVQVDWTAGRVREALAEQRKIASAIRSAQMERDAQQVEAIYSSTGVRAALVREASIRIQRRTEARRIRDKAVRSL